MVHILVPHKLNTRRFQLPIDIKVSIPSSSFRGAKRECKSVAHAVARLLGLLSPSVLIILVFQEFLKTVCEVELFFAIILLLI